MVEAAAVCPHPPPVIAVVGPTATGKSALGVALCLALDGEVVNADSMQLYRGMDVGTAKLTGAERRGVSHHLLDIWEVTEPASVADYQRRARDVIDALRGRGTPPIVVGGSGLYVRSALDRLEFPGTDPALRGKLEAELAEVGPAVLHTRLASRDPAAAERILPSNGRRIVRALEVVELAGTFRAELPESVPAHPTVHLGLDCANDVLDARIAERVERMWAAGFVAEVGELARLGLGAGRTASRALGYQQVLRYLDGACTQRQAKEETVRATRRFVRRQRAWFRRDARIVWLDATSPDLPAAALSHAG